jgi:hypothetical protein
MGGPERELFFVSPASEAELAREKAKARELRQSAWWKRRRSSGRCHYCGRAVPPRELTMDHVVPLVRGGKTVKSNVVPCCKECNARKRYLLPLEWEEYLESLSGGEEEEPPET